MATQVTYTLSDEALACVKEKLAEVNRDFDGGKLKPSDVVNEMILTSKVDIKVLQGKHTNIRRLLRNLATREDIEIDTIIRMVTEAKGRVPKKKTQNEEAN